MSLDFYRLLTRSFGLLALGILFALISFTAVVEIKDLDLWLHLKMGEVITTTGHVPTVDILSGTIAGKPWVNHEWLFQTVVYSVKYVFGLDGLLYMQSILVALTFLLLLLWTYRSDRQLLIIPLLFFVLEVYQTRFTVRPDIFSVLYFILFLMIIFTSMEKRWALPVLFGLQVLWTNMHGYFFWGPALLILFLFGETARRFLPLPSGWKEGALSDRGYARACLALLLLFGATLLNPLMLEGALYPFRTVFSLSGESKVFFKFITELQPSVRWESFFEFGDQMPFKILIVVSAISFVLNARRLHPGWLCVWAAVLCFSVVAVRNMIYFSVIAYLVTFFNVTKMDLRVFFPVRFIAEPFEHVAGWLLKIALSAVLLGYGGDISGYGYYDFEQYSRKSEFLGVAQRMFPRGAVDFLVQNGIQGAVFNDFNSGAYLAGQAYPGIKVFIDGRTEVYGAEFFKEYRKIWDDGDQKAFDAAVRRYDLKAVLIGTAFSRPPAKIMKNLVHHPQWKLVYFDHDGLVFLRDIPEHQDLIRKFGIDMKKWIAPVSDLRRLGSARVAPFRETNRAVMLADMGFEDQALAQADGALAIAPDSLAAYKVKAGIYAGRKDHLRAFENYRWALLQAPDDVWLRRGMALALIGLGDYDRALDQAERLDENVSSPAGAYVRAKVLLKKKQYKKAYDILINRIFLLEQVLPDLVDMGDAYLESGESGWALKAYMLAIRKDPKDPEAFKKFKDVLMSSRKIK